MAQSKKGFSELDFGILGKCPVCKALLRSKQSELVERQPQGSLFHVDCERCQSSVLLMVVNGPLHFLTTIGMLTDISKPDVAHLRSQRPIDVDDVLALYGYFKQHTSRV